MASDFFFIKKGQTVSIESMSVFTFLFKCQYLNVSNLHSSYKSLKNIKSKNISCKVFDVI